MLKDGKIITPQNMIDHLSALESSLGSSKVRAFFLEQSPKVKNEYSLLRWEVTKLVEELKVARLEQIADRINMHTDELKIRAGELKSEIETLSSARKILTRLDKFVSLVSRIAIFLL